MFDEGLRDVRMGLGFGFKSFFRVATPPRHPSRTVNLK